MLTDLGFNPDYFHRIRQNRDSVVLGVGWYDGRMLIGASDKRTGSFRVLVEYNNPLLLWDVAADDRYVYWSECEGQGAFVFRQPIAGGGFESVWEGMANWVSVATSDSFLYIGSHGPKTSEVIRIPKAGGAAESIGTLRGSPGHLPYPFALSGDDTNVLVREGRSDDYLPGESSLLSYFNEGTLTQVNGSGEVQDIWLAPEAIYWSEATRYGDETGAIKGACRGR